MPRSLLTVYRGAEPCQGNGERAFDPSRVVDSAALAAIYEHAVRDYPSECCGFVLASGVRPCLNVQDGLHRADQRLHPRTSRTAFALDFESTSFLIDSLGSDDPVRVIYHSHPDVGAYFSEEDRRFAARDQEPTFPGVDYLVVDVRCRRVAGARLFRLVQGAFRAIYSYQAFP